ncbi:hypothetical protein HF882_06785 [Victivallis vadensis]|uniref:Uncharacterized protein n=1 Tax=Victivallis vadensis TaxID=172901 RepID=A0A848AT22_9BACT|nr:hypothetical protein [Victivallis vadensis]NMD86288.1 hypothetical protein [Victivallis vadensis]
MNSGLGERMGTHEDLVYAIAHTLLGGEGCDYRKIKAASPEFGEELVEAIRVLRENVPEYRDVKVPGLDEE